MKRTPALMLAALLLPAPAASQTVPITAADLEGATVVIGSAKQAFSTCKMTAKKPAPG